MGPAWWKKYSSLVLPMIKPDQRRGVCLLFPPVDTTVLVVIQKVFARDLGGIIQQNMGCRLGYHRSRPCLYALATLIHSWDTAHPCIDWHGRRGRASDKSVTLPAIARVCCGRSASTSCATQTTQIRVLAGMNRTRRSKRVSLLT